MATLTDDERPEEETETPSSTPANHKDHEDHIHRRKDELLDQGVEETFPASDPVAVKHIT